MSARKRAKKSRTVLLIIIGLSQFELRQKDDSRHCRSLLYIDAINEIPSVTTSTRSTVLGAGLASPLVMNTISRSSAGVIYIPDTNVTKSKQQELTKRLINVES